MINFDGKELQEEFNKAFGDFVRPGPIGLTSQTPHLTVENLTLEQLWWLTKFAKHVRGRCRSNAAFNNYMNRNFSPARFENVTKEYNGRTYQGLKITKNEESSEGEDNE
jgi:hypothetical protein